ncbi:TetR/AcrR family transcriptional regulator [Nocardia sp. CA2R105]|uniref:TetR/AcrR family transcriptional regulator n=1 Tax=Nocardia coffeae TaxID=2873381 RepID=UPI001CA62D70|nr:TetR/AcrR family transcriptional regulator [Nocardia coffeae]MBY8859446.1 TetR/AcrR family transcriptional regulator [Nocardia coffeae]
MAAARDDMDERILDAALTRVLQVGIRRASLDDIARRAGVNRVTIYRRFTTKENLIDAMLAREIQRTLAEVTTIATATKGVDNQIEETIVYVLTQTHAHPLVTQLLDVAPEEILDFYTVRGQESVKIGIRYIVQVLETTQKSGAIDDYDTRPVAELLARLAHSVLLTPAGEIDFRDEEQVRAFVATSIVPLVKHGLPTRSATGGRAKSRTKPAARSR